MCCQSPFKIPIRGIIPGRCGWLRLSLGNLASVDMGGTCHLLFLETPRCNSWDQGEPSRSAEAGLDIPAGISYLLLR